MWLVLSRAPRPDAPYWPGRAVLALVDAVIWPAAWIALALHLPQPAGIVGSMFIAVAGLSLLSRTHRAVRRNHRYHFTTWRWGRLAAVLLLLGVFLKIAAGA